MRKFTLLAALYVLALGQLRAQITTYHDTLPDGTTLTLVDSGQPPIEVMIDSMFGSLDFTEVSSGLLMDRTIHFVDYTRYDGTLSDSNSNLRCRFFPQQAYNQAFLLDLDLFCK